MCLVTCLALSSLAQVFNPLFRVPTPLMTLASAVLCLLALNQSVTGVQGGPVQQQPPAHARLQCSDGACAAA